MYRLADSLWMARHNSIRVVSVPRRLADTRRARDEIGFVAEVPLEDGLRRLAAWRKETLAREEIRV